MVVYGFLCIMGWFATKLQTVFLTFAVVNQNVTN